MNTPEDFEQRLTDRLARAGEGVPGEGVTLDGVHARHRRRARALRLRRGAGAAVAAGVLVVGGIVALGAGTGGDGPRDEVATGDGGGPATAGDAPSGSRTACIDGLPGAGEIVVFLDPTVLEVDRSVLAETLGDDPRLGGLRYVDQEETFEELRAAAITIDLRSLDLRAVPPSYRATLVVPDSEALAALLRDYEGRPGVLEVVLAGESARPGPDGSEAVSPPVRIIDPVHDREELERWLEEGGSAELTPEQIDELVTYLLGLGRSEVSFGDGPVSVDLCAEVDPVPAAGGEEEDGHGPDEEGTTSVPTTSMPTTSVPTTSQEQGTTPSRVEWPASTVPVHGHGAWAVYLAVVPEVDGTDASDLRRTADEAASVGYAVGPSELACDQGAVEALGLDPSVRYYGQAVYFAEEAEARRFTDLFTEQYLPGPVGLALVTTYCLD